MVSREASSRAENERGRDLACGGVYHVSSGVEDESTAEILDHTYFLVQEIHFFLPHSRRLISCLVLTFDLLTLLHSVPIKENGTSSANHNFG